MKKIFKICRVIIFVLPILLGAWGMHFLEGESLLDSVFNSLLMYFFCYTDHPANIFIEIARWLAPAVTASGVLLIFYRLRDNIIHFLLFYTGKSIAVYGPEGEKNAILDEIRHYRISGKDVFVPASRYILLNDEETNFAFYNANKAKMKNRTVYLKSQSLPAEAVCDSELRLFCPEESSARLFWKRNFLYPLSLQNDHKLNIVLIGFEKLGEELLLFGLQNNIFSPDQRITYHIFGDGTHFRASHLELDSISDPIIFYEKSWDLHLELIEQAYMVIVLTQKNQMELLRELLFTTIRERIHIFASDISRACLLDGNERLVIFDWKSEAQKLDYILNDTLFTHAKRINLRYAHIYSGVPETEESMENEWKALDTFTRYSNVSSADYHEVRLKMLAASGNSGTTDLTDDELEFHAELEHIRWCRYHYLNNWKYGVPDNGKNKDKKLRIHSDLIPYQTLTEAEKEKDRENIRLLLSIQ